ncbi:DoxX family protein [Cupriavidus necator]|uniref:DoxX family protein n=1 Tax=Cupriavidus necator TaxID=106590 RepID=A0A1U9UNZ6_CUPNE|nr:DoxX family protein [Cupriavidus necator]AQV94167.1 DoxX family protein [Cupriavidus necator]
MGRLNTLEDTAALVGRILIGGMFLANSAGLSANFAAVARLMAGKGIPLAPWLLALAIALWVLGGLSIVVGYKLRWCAVVLACALVPVTLCMHAPWNADAASFPNELNHFLKNLAILGGVLYVAAYGAGGWSLDARMAGGESGPGNVSQAGTVSG